MDSENLNYTTRITFITFMIILWWACGTFDGDFFIHTAYSGNKFGITFEC